MPVEVVFDDVTPEVTPVEFRPARLGREGKEAGHQEE
jgi:hypothetical protein